MTVVPDDWYSFWGLNFSIKMVTSCCRRWNLGQLYRIGIPRKPSKPPEIVAAMLQNPLTQVQQVHQPSMSTKKYCTEMVKQLDSHLKTFCCGYPSTNASDWNYIPGSGLQVAEGGLMAFTMHVFCKWFFQTVAVHQSWKENRAGQYSHYRQKGVSTRKPSMGKAPYRVAILASNTAKPVIRVAGTPKRVQQSDKQWFSYCYR